MQTTTHVLGGCVSVSTLTMALINAKKRFIPFALYVNTVDADIHLFCLIGVTVVGGAVWSREIPVVFCRACSTDGYRLPVVFTIHWTDEQIWSTNITGGSIITRLCRSVGVRCRLLINHVVIVRAYLFHATPSLSRSVVYYRRRSLRHSRLGSHASHNPDRRHPRKALFLMGLRATALVI